MKPKERPLLQLRGKYDSKSKVFNVSASPTKKKKPAGKAGFLLCVIKQRLLDRARKILGTFNTTLKVLPVVVDISLDLFEDMLVAGLEEMLETTLWLEEFRDRDQILIANRSELPHAILDLEQWPELGVHSETADLCSVTRIDAPTAWARSEDVQECRTINSDGLLSLVDEVTPVADRSLRNIRNTMRRDDRGEILANLRLALLNLTNLRGGRPSTLRCCR